MLFKSTLTIYLHPFLAAQCFEVGTLCVKSQELVDVNSQTRTLGALIELPANQSQSRRYQAGLKTNSLARIMSDRRCLIARVGRDLNAPLNGQVKCARVLF